VGGVRSAPAGQPAAHLLETAGHRRPRSGLAALPRAEQPDDLGQAVDDVYRVAKGKIVEHWNVVQNVPATSANNNTMF